MPLKKSDIKGKTLQELKDLLQQEVIRNNPNLQAIEMVRKKIEKRLREGDTLPDNQMLNEVFGVFGL